MKNKPLILILILVFASCSQPKPDSDYININFGNYSVEEFINYISKTIDKKIVIEEHIKGKINFVANKSGVKKSELIPLLNAILETKKRTLLNKGDYYTVVKSAIVPGCLFIEEDKFKNQKMETVVFELDKLDGKMIKTKIKPLLHKNAKATLIKKNNLLSITAYSGTLRAIKTLIEKIKSRLEVNKKL